MTNVATPRVANYAKRYGLPCHDKKVEGKGPLVNDQWRRMPRGSYEGIITEEGMANEVDEKKITEV